MFSISYNRYLGRGVVYYRINGNPIKTLADAIKRNQLDVAAKILASPECYEKLYPVKD